MSNKVVTILETLSKHELTQLKKYLLSPFFNENENIVALFNLLDRQLRSKDDRPLFDDKSDWQRFVEGAWKHIFKTKKYSDTKFRRLCSDLNQLTQDFLGYKEYATHPITKNNHILKALNERELSKHFSAVERQTRNIEQKQTHRNASSFFENFQLETEYHNHLEQTTAQQNFQGNLLEADYYLDCHYWSNKLKMHSESLNNKTILNTDEKINLIDELLKYVKDSRLIEVPAIAIYYHIIMTFQGEDKEFHFRELLRIATAAGDLFPQTELRSIYIFAQNFCIRRINSGKLEYYEQLYAIYKALLEREVIFTHNQLSPRNYKNIVTVALFVKEYEWVEDFILQYNTKLPKAYQASLLSYNMACLHFNKAEYHKAIEQLREVQFQDAFDGLSSRWLLLKTYFELDEIDAFEALTDSFSIFIRRNKALSERNKQKYLNAIRFIAKIQKVPYQNEKIHQALHQKLTESKVIIDKRWLLDKLEYAKPI